MLGVLCVCVTYIYIHMYVCMYRMYVSLCIYIYIQRGTAFEMTGLGFTARILGFGVWCWGLMFRVRFKV